jgi:hypothetical protein
MLFAPQLPLCLVDPINYQGRVPSCRFALLLDYHRRLLRLEYRRFLVVRLFPVRSLALLIQISPL